jgi:hypothetical protein
MSEDADESHQSEEEDEDAEAERWYRDLGINRDEMFILRLQEFQDPNHPLNRRSSNVVGTSDVCMSSRHKVNDSNQNLTVQLDDKPSQKDNMHEAIEQFIHA